MQSSAYRGGPPPRGEQQRCLSSAALTHLFFGRRPGFASWKWVGDSIRGDILLYPCVLFILCTVCVSNVREKRQPCNTPPHWPAQRRMTDTLLHQRLSQPASSCFFRKSPEHKDFSGSFLIFFYSHSRTCLLILERGGRREREKKTLISCLSNRLQRGIKPAAQVCALTRNRTRDLLVYRTTLQPTESPARAQVPSKTDCF